MQAILKTSKLIYLPVRTRVKKNKEHPFMDRLMVHTNGEIHILPYAEIKFVKADNQYSRINLCQERSIFSSYSLKVIREKIYSPHFYRIHQSILLNITFIRSITSTHVRLDCGTELPISRRQRKSFLEFMQEQCAMSD